MIARCFKSNVFKRVFTIFMHTVALTRLHHEFFICSVVSLTSIISTRFST